MGLVALPPLKSGNASPKLMDHLRARYPPTDEVFFAQNAGAKDAGTGANKSAIVQKISLAQAAEAVRRANGAQNATGIVQVQTINSNHPIVNPNGATNYRGEIVFAAEGQNADKPSEIIRLNPRAPYNTTGEQSTPDEATLHEAACRTCLGKC